MSKKILLKISAGIIAFLLILVVFFVANSFLGNPVSENIAKDKGLVYINDKYSHLDLEIKNVTYNLKDGSYLIFISSNTSIDTHFLLRYRDGEIYSDNYEDSVLSGKNTMDRFCAEYKKSLTPLVQAKTNGVKNISVLPEELVKYDYELDSTFDKNLVKNVDIFINYTEGTDLSQLSNVLKTTYDVMIENGYYAASFAITGSKELELIEFINIKDTHIESENLEGILQEAITNTEHDGIISFSKGQ